VLAYELRLSCGAPGVERPPGPGFPAASGAAEGQQLGQRWIGNLAKRLFEAVLLGTERSKYLAYYVGSSELRAFVRHCRNEDNLLAPYGCPRS
jgi:hypothetical protein